MAKEQTETGAPIALTMDQFEKLLATLQQSKSSSPELETAIAAIQATVQANDKLATEVERTVRKSNATNQNISLFTIKADCEYCSAGLEHPDTKLIGHTQPKLKFDRVEFPDKGWRVWPDQCSVLEVELLNSFTSSVSARNGDWKATIDPKANSLLITLPYRCIDERTNMPAFVQVLVELLRGRAAADPVNLLEQVAILQKQVAELQATR